MRATVQTHCGQIEVEGTTQAELFERMASAVEVFDQTYCGLCKSERIVPVCRHSDKYTFFQYQCRECGAELKMGQVKEGGRLFPVRKLDRDGRPDSDKGTTGSHNGWYVYRGENAPQQAAPIPQRQEPPAKPTGQPAGLAPGQMPALGLPMTACELFDRLRRTQEQLERDGRCFSGDLLAYADTISHEMGFPQTLDKWTLKQTIDCYRLCGVWIGKLPPGRVGAGAKAKQAG